MLLLYPSPGELSLLNSCSGRMNLVHTSLTSPAITRARTSEGTGIDRFVNSCWMRVQLERIALFVEGGARVAERGVEERDKTSRIEATVYPDKRDEGSDGTVRDCNHACNELRSDMLV